MPNRRPYLGAVTLCLALLLLAVPLTAGAPRTAVGTTPGGGGGSNGTLFLSVAPSTASVVVDSRPVALMTDGSAVVTLPAGTYPVTAQAKGYEPFEGNVTILSNQSAYLSIQLLATSGGGGGVSGSPYLTTPVLATVVGAAVIIALGLFLLRPASRAGTRSDPATTQTPPPPSEEGPE